MSIRARTIAKSQYIPMVCAIYRGHMRGIILGAFATPKCGKQTPFIPSEVLKNLIGGLLIDLCSISMASDYAA